MDAVLLATLNALWQGTALIALVMLALRAGLRRNATTACVVWSVTFLIIAALPVLDLALARPSTSAPPPSPAIALDVSRTELRLNPPAARPAQRVVLDIDTTAALPSALPQLDVTARQQNPTAATPLAGVRAAVETAFRRADALVTQLGAFASRFSRAWGAAILAAWSLVTGTLLFRLGLAYLAVVRAKRNATPLDDAGITAQLRSAGHRRGAIVASSAEVEIPCAIGFNHPMILIPSALVATLDRDDLARIVLHESAHLQRYDDCVNALEQIVCAVQFFQPALYLARRRIDFEREVACDDRVLEDSGDPLRYAECLARIVQRQVRGRQVAVVPGFVLRRAQVVARVRRIVDRSRDASPHLRFGALVLGGAVLASTLGIARLQVPLVGPVAAETAAPPASPVPAVAPAAPLPAPHAATVRRAAKVHVVRAVPLHEVTVQGVQVSVPAMHLAVPELHLSVPEMRLSAPELHVSVPEVRVVVPQRYAASSAPLLAQADAAVLAASISRRDDLLAAIDDAKYPHPSVDDLIALKNHGVSGSFIRAMGALGAGRPTIAQLIQLADQAIPASYYGAMEHDLAMPPTLDQVVELRQQGVSARWLEAFAASGYPKLSVADAIALAQQGVSASYAHGLTDAGLKGLTPAQLVNLRNHGVDASFVRHLYEHGYRNFNLDELIRLKDSGF